VALLLNITVDGVNAELTIALDENEHFVDSMTMLVKAVSPEKTLRAIDVTEAGIAIDANLLHREKALPPIVVSDEFPSKVTLVKAVS
jgi:hypothetical protein